MNAKSTDELVSAAGNLLNEGPVPRGSKLLRKTNKMEERVVKIIRRHYVILELLWDMPGTAPPK